METAPDYQSLYEAAQLELQNLRNQIIQWELRAEVLTRLISHQETYAKDIEIKMELLKLTSSDIRKIVYRKDGKP